MRYLISTTPAATHRHLQIYGCSYFEKFPSITTSWARRLLNIVGVSNIQRSIVINDAHLYEFADDLSYYNSYYRVAADQSWVLHSDKVKPNTPPEELEMVIQKEIECGYKWLNDEDDGWVICRVSLGR